MTLGVPAGKVILREDHDAWAEAFARERLALEEVLGSSIVAVEHAGSTSIPEVPAKPILDILVGVRDFEEARACVSPMIAVGYAYRGENGIPRRHYFVQGDPRSHHVHMLEVDSPAWAEMLRFRDLLRADRDLAREYAAEKRRLAERYGNDREAYQREKDKVVVRILSGR